jgi:hypothetical protein
MEKGDNMTDVELTDSSLALNIQGIDQFLSFRKHIEAPLEHVLGAVVGIDPEVQVAFGKSLRLPGAYMPGLVVAGSYFQFKDKTWLFYNTHAGYNAITIKLAHEHYEALVVEVADPMGTVAAINAAVAKRGVATG